MTSPPPVPRDRARACVRVRGRAARRRVRPLAERTKSASGLKGVRRTSNFCRGEKSMRHPSRMAVLSAAVVGVCAGVSRAEQFLTPNDFIIAIDGVPDFYQDNTGGGGTSSMYPISTESPDKAIDGDPATKYLNFGRMGGGFIVQPGSSSTVQSFKMFTGNDAPERDPTSYVLMGTNAPIVGAD